MEADHEFEISQEEAELYDRQIRLWGLDAQKRLRSSSVLLVGINGLGAEVAKNLVLAGVKSLKILDHNKVSESDSILQFLFSFKDIGENRAELACRQIQLLNPMVEVSFDTRNVMELEDAYFQSYSAVCVMSSDTTVLYHLNKLCSRFDKKFFCGDVWGFYGYCFLDLGQHSYVEEKFSFVVKEEDEDDEPKAKRMHTEEKLSQMISKTIDFPPLEKAMAMKVGKSNSALNKQTSPLLFLLHVLFRFQTNNKRCPLPEKRTEDIESMQQIKDTTMNELGIDSKRLDDKIFTKVFGEISPVCAVVGGVLAQEIIKTVSGKDSPIKNFFLFDGNKGEGIVENIGR